MSRKTKSRRSARSDRAASSPRWIVQDSPRLEEPLSLICGACGAEGEYDVGTVTIDPEKITTPDLDAVEESVGFTGYFRCHKCDAGGPWKLPPETSVEVTAMMVASLCEMEDVPLILGCTRTFDKHTIRYATDGEAHLKKLIEREPERAFLWTRLGNLYSHAGAEDRAETVFRRAIELDPEDIEAHGMLGQLLLETHRPLEAVPHFHAVLKNVRHANQVEIELRRILVRSSIESLLAAHAETNGQIELLPLMSPDEIEKRNKDEPVVIELLEIDLGSDEGVDDLCEKFLGRPRQRSAELFRRREKRTRDATDDWVTAPIHREGQSVGRNDPCPCGSGHKYKKCCGR